MVIAVVRASQVTNPPMEPTPTSSSVFPVTAPSGDGEGPVSPDDMVLSYISRMLMEDDIDDKFSDHPALLQAQQAFAQILSSPSFASNSSTISKGVTEGSIQSIAPNLAFTKGGDAVRAVLRWRWSSNATMEMEEPAETGGTQEMFDEMMLRGYETLIRDTKKLRITMAADEVKKKEKNGKGGTARTERYVVVDLHTLLIRCAQAVDTNEYASARELLRQIKQSASATGDATQRLAQCFTRGLEARLAGTGSQLLLMARRPSATEFVRAHKLFMAACCFSKVTLVFSIASIARAMAGKSRLHIVDYGPHHGFHWASLLRFLASREGGPPESVRITAVVGCPQLTPFFPVEQIEETGRGLSRCARAFGLPSFRFRVIPARPEAVRVEDLSGPEGDAAGEVLVVNELFSFNALMDESVVCVDDVSPRDAVLGNIRGMRPDLFIQGVVNCSRGASFLTRFREALFYYAAVFDALDATAPRESAQRRVLEQDVLGPAALNVVACEGRDRSNRSDTYRQ